MEEVKKVVIPITSPEMEFLPFSNLIPKEIFPLADKPIAQYLIQEAKESEIDKIFFLANGKKNLVADYLATLTKLGNNFTNKQEVRDKPISNTGGSKKAPKEASSFILLQAKSLSNINTIKYIGEKLGKEATALMLGSYIVNAKTPCLLQLKNIFKTAKKPVIALARVSQEEISNHSIAQVERIAKRVFKIKKIVHNPSPEQAPSDLAIIGRYILNHETFVYAAKTKVTKEREENIINVFEKMLEEGKSIYGYEFEGEWFEIKTIANWLKAFFYFSLKNENFNAQLQKFLKENRLI